MRFKIQFLSGVAVASLFAVSPVAQAQESFTVDPALAEQGERIFKGPGSCMGCHILGKRMAGPDLIGVTTRRGVDWVRRFIADPEEMIATDPQAEAMWEEWRYTMQTPRLRDSQIEAIIHYLVRETEKAFGTAGGG